MDGRDDQREDQYAARPFALPTSDAVIGVPRATTAYRAGTYMAPTRFFAAMKDSGGASGRHDHDPDRLVHRK